MGHDTNRGRGVRRGTTGAGAGKPGLPRGRRVSGPLVVFRRLVRSKPVSLAEGGYGQKWPLGLTQQVGCQSVHTPLL